jgi:hypothetical protein
MKCYIRQASTNDIKGIINPIKKNSDTKTMRAAITNICKHAISINSLALLPPISTSNILTLGIISEI